MKDRYYSDKCKADDVKNHGGREHLFRSYVQGLCWVMKVSFSFVLVRVFVVFLTCLFPIFFSTTTRDAPAGSGIIHSTTLPLRPIFVTLTDFKETVLHLI